MILESEVGLYRFLGAQTKAYASYRNDLQVATV
jgi:hypothetical protein